MLSFSTLLSNYIKEKNIRTQLLAEYCNIDRCNMYKILKGQRKPTSDEVVSDIADYLKLTLKERNELFEAYHIEIIGYETYFRRKNAQQFISDFSKIFSQNTCIFNTINASVKSSTSPDESPDVLALKTKEELYHIIWHIMAHETEKEDATIKLVVQPTTESFMEMLSNVCQNKLNVSIEHIFCLNNTTSTTESETNYNLNCLQKILPLYNVGQCEYNPLYYYDNILSHDNIFHLFSSAVITSDYALIFSSACEQGILFSQPEMIQLLQNIYDRLKNYTKPMIQKVDSFFTQFTYFQKLIYSTSKNYSFQNQPCIIPLMPVSFLDKYVIPQLPNRDDFLAATSQYFLAQQERCQQQHVNYIFAEEGFLEFMRTGRAFEIPEAVYTPISKEDRLIILQNLIDRCNNGSFRMIHKNCPFHNFNFCIFVNSRQGYIQFLTTNNDLVILNLEEPDLLYTFFDFMESIPEEYYYTKEEAIERLKKIPETLWGEQNEPQDKAE